MLTTVLTASLLVAAPLDTPSRYERAFQAARQMEVAGYTPDLVFMMESRNELSWQVVSFYRVSSSASEVRWVVRRQRQGGQNWGYSNDPIVPLAWADSRNWPGVVSVLEAVERIPAIPFDVFRIGTEYGADDDVLVGGARMNFWLAGATATPSIQLRGFRYLGNWWSDGEDALESCWTTAVPSIERED